METNTHFGKQWIWAGWVLLGAWFLYTVLILLAVFVFKGNDPNRAMALVIPVLSAPIPILGAIFIAIGYFSKRKQSLAPIGTIPGESPFHPIWGMLRILGLTVIAIPTLYYLQFSIFSPPTSWVGLFRRLAYIFTEVKGSVFSKVGLSLFLIGFIPFIFRKFKT